MEVKAATLEDSVIDMDKRTFKGYASTWDIDKVDDIIHRGAFTKSISESFPKGSIKILWQHSEPLGIPIAMSEDDKGLYVEGRISKTRLGDEALELMRDGVVDKMSIGFTIPSGKSDIDEKGIRNIREVKLMEFSPVTFPANEAAVITGVKQIKQGIKNGASIDDVKALVKSLDELKALVSELEPIDKITQQDYEPLELEALMADIKNLGALALHIK
jgi:HK97 family phage prohead protease